MIDPASPDTAQIARIIRAQFPGLDPVHVRFLGDGYDSSAFEVNDGLVFRFPKRADVEAQLLTEAALLAALAALRPPVPIPDFQFHGVPSAGFPRRFAGYPKLHGSPANEIDALQLDFRPLAAPLAGFLSWLHAFPPDEALRLGVPDQRDQSLLKEISDEALAHVGELHEVSPDAPLKEWRDFLEILPPPATSSSFAVVHNDLAAEHVLIDPVSQSVTGIIDWSDVAVGDRAIDFAGFWHWAGREFLEAVLAEYAGAIDEGARSRARYFAACRGVLDVVFGRKRNRPAYVTAGLRALAMSVPKT